MNEATTHIIQKQTFLFNAIKHQPAYLLQDRISKYCRDQLAGSLEKLFDLAINKDIFIRVDKLEINVGAVSVNKLEEELTTKIHDEIEKRLKEIVQGSDSSLYSVIEKYPKGEMLERQFWFFLLNGYLPSWSNNTSLAGVTEWLLTVNPGLLREEIVWAIRENTNIAKRLIYHFENAILERIFHMGSLEIPPGELIRSFDVIQNYTGLSAIQIREIFWLNIFKITDPANIMLGNILSAFYQSITPLLPLKKEAIENLVTGEYNFFKTFFQNILKQNSQISPVSKEILVLAIQAIVTRIEERSELKNAHQAKNAQHAVTEKPVDQQGISTGNISIGKAKNNDVITGPEKNPSAVGNFSETPKNRKNTDNDDAVYVDFAGIVLLHPFLNTLFTEMELIKENEWMYERAQQKAVQVLAYLAHDEDFCPEYKMPLLKVLCGLGSEDFVMPSIILTEYEKTLTNEVLLAVLKHWGAIRNTSVAGLQESFLQRGGKLVAVEKGWKLTVERKTIDILVSKLPWGVSFVKLPWLKQMLFVDWV